MNTAQPSICTPSPKRRRFRALSGVLVTALACSSLVMLRSSPAEALSYHQWSIDANTLKVADAQEESWYEPWKYGDEVQLGVIAFNTVLGTPGSTNAWYVGNQLNNVTQDGDDGETFPIDNSTGRANFGYRRSLSLDDIDKGYKPTIIGTIQVSIEEDGTPDSVWEDKFRELASITKQELAAASESLTTADLNSLSEVTARFKTAAKRIQDRVKLDWYEKVKVFIKSLGDPDEMVDFKITALVAVEDDLAPLVDLALDGALGEDGFAGALRSRSVIQHHKGEGAVYMVTSQVGTY